MCVRKCFFTEKELYYETMFGKIFNHCEKKKKIQSSQLSHYTFAYNPDIINTFDI